MESIALPALVPANMNGVPAPALSQPANNPLAMPVPVQAVIARHEAIQEIVKGVFQDGTHFGKIPGTGDKKTLLKPGFDTLCEAFQFSPDFVKQPESIETDKFINLVYKCVLTSSSGRVVATGIGSCNSKEEKYRWINSARKCPACGKEAISKSKEEWGGGWYCADKKGGCGAKFKKGDRAIEDQEAGRKENDNAWNHHNTLTKMAQKRAGMAAIITACGISGDFTQDVEDMDLGENAKSARREEGIDIQGQGPAGYENPGWRARAEADDRRVNDDPGSEHYGQPEPWSEGAAAVASQVLEDAQFTPAPAAPTAPVVPPDIQKAMDEVTLELRYCKTKEQYQRLAGLMRSQGGPMRDTRVTAIFNQAYYAAFPKTIPAAAGA